MEWLLSSYTKNNLIKIINFWFKSHYPLSIKGNLPCEEIHLETAYLVRYVTVRIPSQLSELNSGKSILKITFKKVFE